MRATLADWRFVAFVSTLLLCGGPRSATQAAPHGARRAPTRANAAGALRPVVVETDSAFGDVLFEGIDATPDGRTHESLRAPFDRDLTATTADDEDGTAALAAAHDEHRVELPPVGTPVDGATFACLVRATATPLLRGPPRVRRMARPASSFQQHPARRRRTMRPRAPGVASSCDASSGSFVAVASGGSAALIPVPFHKTDMRSVRRRLWRAPPP